MLNQIQQIRDFLTKGEVEQSLEKLIEIDSTDEVIFLSEWYYSVEKEYHLGKIGYSEYSLNRRKIVVALIAVIDRFNIDNKAIDSLKKQNTDDSFLKDQIKENYRLYRAGKYIESLDKYNILLDKYPNNTDILIGLGRVYTSLLNHSQAIESYKKAIKINTNLDIPLNNLGVVYEKIGKSDIAASFYKSAFEKSPSIDLYLNNYIRLSKLKNKDLEAVKYCEEKSLIYTEIPNLHYKLAELYSGYVKDYRSALVSINRAIYLLDTDPNYYYTKSLILSKIEKHEEALESIDKSIEIASNDDFFHTFRAALLLDRKDYISAIPSLNISIELNPHSSSPFLMLGICYYNIEQYEEAIKYLTNCYLLKPNECQAYEYLSKSFEKKRKKQLARQFRAKAKACYKSI